MDKTYIDTVRLLLEIVPEVFRSGRFAMKGGTALNLFVRNMPRLSVDIDVVYIDHEAPRDEALVEISNELAVVVSQLESRGISSEFVRTKSGDEVKILARRGSAMVKVEVNFVFRGMLLPVEQRSLVVAAQQLFTTDLSAPVLADAELYGSKIVAALDRQHPRDFFDLLELVENRDLSADVMNCFLCYLAGHNRPVHEVLFSRDLDLAGTFENEFQGMTRETVSLGTLLDARQRLRTALRHGLNDRHKNFLLGIVKLDPDWKLIPFTQLQNMPAIRWKLANLAKLKRNNPAKFLLQTEMLLRHFA